MGNPRRGFPLILRFCVCAVSLGSSLYPLLPFDPISLGKHQRNGVEWQGKPMTPSQRIGAHA